LDSSANSALGIAKRSLDLIQVAGDIVSLDRSPLVGNLDDPGLQVSQHGGDRRQLRRIVPWIGLPC